METSSPLAAMQPQTIVFGHSNWKCGAERPTSNPTLKPPVFGHNVFTFKDMNFGRRKPDYFTLQPSRGNSPTANLAVDLSQNFHIDRSPAPPTPRRSLFSTMVHPINTRAVVTTPPPSSPSPMLESMEISPLPHKVPFVAQISTASPTPEHTPSITDETALPMSYDEVAVESPVEPMPPPPQPERKRPQALRPTFTRIKGYSTTAVATKSATFPSNGRTFDFGPSVVPSVPSLTLDDCFMESPPRSTSPPSLAPPVAIHRPKSATHKVSAFALPSGSPSAPPSRKPLAPYQRPRKQFRRSLSMFEHPEDVIHRQTQEERRPEVPLQCIMDIDENPKLQLPHFFPDQESIPRITKDTMVDILDGKYAERYSKTMIVDCRFEYEYKGGHIDGAVNFNDKEELAKQLFENASENTLLVFHCEYSAHRAPIAARFIRGEDRNANVHQYPKLNYPEVYILDGGYSSFFKDHKTRCFPPNYVEMNAKEHATACERGLGRIKQQRSKLCRAQTFAFGQQNPINDSPTAVGRQPSNSLMNCMDIVIDEHIEPMRRLGAQRTVSY